MLLSLQKMSTASESGISVVIPTYNGARFIERAVRSVFGQTQLPVEIIVVDDCSSDATLEILSSLVQSSPVPLRLMRLSRNSGGPSRPLNTGINAAACDLIALLEQDDLMRPSRLETQLQAARQFPECSLVAGRFAVYGNEEGDLRPVWPEPQFNGIIDDLDGEPRFVVLDRKQAFRALLRKQIMGGNSNFFFTKRSWKRLKGFSEKIRLCVDLDFALKATLDAPVVVVKEIITDYDCRADSLFHANTERAILEPTIVRLKHAAAHPALARDGLAELQDAILWLAKGAFVRRDWATLGHVLVPVLRDGAAVRRLLPARWADRLERE
jgi:glycosyltransferase involved in cell wall biosynthesis